MSNTTVKCGKCVHYSNLKKPKRNGEGYVPLKRGYCLHKTVFASNRPGDEIYPVGAKVAALPNGHHNIVVVREDELVLSCVAAQLRKE